MTEEKSKKTLTESLLILLGTAVATPFVLIGVGLPMMLFQAWMRNLVWEWFAVPYFHAPHVGVWMMLAFGVFIGLFVQRDELKPEHYKRSFWGRVAFAYYADAIGLLFAYGVHHWILRG